MVERQIVALDVVGSSPTILPLFLFNRVKPDFGLLRKRQCQPAMGCSQVVRHGTLTPAFAGSSPATPAV